MSDMDSSYQDSLLKDQKSIETLNSIKKQAIQKPSKFKPSQLTEKLHDLIKDQLKEENIDEEEIQAEIQNTDIRFMMACREATNLLSFLETSQLKEEYKRFKILITIMSYAKYAILASVILILFLGKPEWCDKATYTKNDCSANIDPTDKRKFVLGEFPIIIDADEKNSLLLMNGILLQILNFVKLKLCINDQNEKNAFLTCMTINIAQFVFYFLQQQHAIQFRVMDILSILMILLGVPKLKSISDQFINVMYNSKEILIFSGLFILTFSATTFVYFNNIEDFYDNSNIGSFSTFNFSSYTDAIYTVSLTTFESTNILEILLFLQPVFKFGIVIYFFFALMAKIFLQNLLIGLMYNNYIETFNENVNYISQKYPQLSLMIKYNIAKGTLNGTILYKLVQKSFISSFFDKNSMKIHEFINNNIEDESEENQKKQSFQEDFRKLINSVKYKLFFGYLDVFKLLLLLYNIEKASQREIEYIRIFNFFLLNFYVLESIMRLSIDNFNFSLSNFLEYFNIASCLVSTACYFICTMIQDKDINGIFLNKNEIWNTILDLIVITNSYNTVRLLLLNELIATIFTVIVRALVYIKDILSILFVVLLLFSSLGMILFGGVVLDENDKILEEQLGYIVQSQELTYNFNDYYNSFQTLTIALFTGINDIAKINNDPEKSFIKNIFFITFFVLSAMCLLNIIYGFLIDNCQSYLEENLGKKVDDDIEKTRRKTQLQQEGVN